MMQLDGADIAIVVVYTLLLIIIGCLTDFARYRKSNARGHRVAEAHFLADRSVPWIVSGAALFTADITAITFTGVIGSAADRGFVVVHHDWWGGAMILILLAYVFVPVYLSSKVSTTAEFIGHRFDKRVQLLVAVIFILYLIIAVLRTIFFLGSDFLRTVFDLSSPIAASVIFFIVSGLYVILGGLRSVVYTELLQCFVIVASGVGLTAYTLQKGDGWKELMNNSPEMFILYKPANDPDFPFIGVLFLPLTVSYFWIGNQTVTQRVLASKNVAHAKAGSIFCGVLKIVTGFLFVIPGVAANGFLSEDELEPDRVFDAILRDLPHGLLGLIVVGFVGSLISTVSAAFNAAGAIFAIDIIPYFKPQIPIENRVVFGRVAGAIVLVCSAGSVYFVREGQDIYEEIQEITTILFAPVSAVYLLGVLWPRSNEIGAFYSLVVGFLLSLVRMILVLVYPRGDTNSATRLPILEFLTTVQTFYVSLFLFVLTCVLIAFISLYSKPPDAKQLIGYTIMTVGLRRDSEVEEVNESISELEIPFIQGSEKTIYMDDIDSEKDDPVEDVPEDANGVKAYRDLEHVNALKFADQPNYKTAWDKWIISDIVATAIVVTNIVLWIVYE